MLRNSRDSPVKFFEDNLYLPGSGERAVLPVLVAHMQNGCLDTYLLYVFLAVVAVILFLGVPA